MNQATDKSRNDNSPKRGEDSSPDEGLRSLIAQYRQAYPRLATVAAAIVGDQAQAEDIVQEAAIIAMEKIADFQVGTNITAWLAEIVRRCALNYRRKIQNRKTFAADPASLVQLAQDTATAVPSPIVDPAGNLLADQSAFDDELSIALGRLSHDARCCLLLRTIQKLSYTEIAEIMQIPEGTAMSHVHRSKNELRNRLRPTTTVKSPSAKSFPERPR
jgi:RNA polymerase sigma-70 factor (ECF subfamily)